MSALTRLKTLYTTIRLIKIADSLFALASRGRYHEAMSGIADTKRRWGDLSEFQFGVELLLLEIFLKGCLSGIKASDFDWVALREIILKSKEYNNTEKLYMIVYLEELARTAGFYLDVSTATTFGKPERVSSRLMRRFPNISHLV